MKLLPSSNKVKASLSILVIKLLSCQRSGAVKTLMKFQRLFYTRYISAA